MTDKATFTLASTLTRCRGLLDFSKRNDSKQMSLDIRDFANLMLMADGAIDPEKPFTIEEGKLHPNYTIPMILTCPACGERHIDEAEFATVAHHTHACQSCGTVWRPAKVNTHGVQFLPGYTNAAKTA